ncbi:MAG: benzoyl-CoA-dihydrodiol lyase [Polyangiaceae bacterium]|nr:benzoyl-CoA-dihydrodiol lyase [Polyangiaceae bacterium]
MAASDKDTPAPIVRFDTEPSRYRHWQLTTEGPLARLAMKVDDTAPFRPGYALKLNSYDLGVDIELADAVTRLRFEHPEVRCVVVTSALPSCFCAGANIYMLGSSSHDFKVNFCKFTNETRLALEEAGDRSGQRYVAALNGVASGGGYELALACHAIYLQDDGSSAVSFPETPLLAVLPGTGGLTRLVDKRKVRRDLADVFSTLAEGVRGKRAKDWGLVDDVFPKSRFDGEVNKRALALAEALPAKKGPGVKLPPVAVERRDEGGKSRAEYRHVSLVVDRAKRVAELTLRGPADEPATSAEAFRERGVDNWAFALFRELDAALLDLRFNCPEVGLIVARTAGEPERVRAHDRALLALAETDWLAHEVVLHMARVLKRFELSARSIFATLEPGSCFAGSLFEVALLADRSYMLDAEGGPRIGLSPANVGPLRMANGLTRLETRFLATPARVAALAGEADLLDAAGAAERGLVTFTPDDIDWEDDVRIAVEERASLSPDALTGMEANLRFAGPETMETKIFARLSAWQNWIFQRPNATGPRGALTMYGRPERPEFDWRRT